MNYQFKIIRKENLTTSRWSGGTTTQLYIYPQSALYAERNFYWRISSAVVEAPESDFTPLPGFLRIIMILEGELHLMHSGQHECYLKPFHQDTFLGDWQTKSKGIVTDFNLMLNQECKGSLTAIALSPREEKITPLCNDFPASSGLQKLTDVFYLCSGSVEIILFDEVNILNKGDLLLVERAESAETIQLRIKNSSDTPAGIVHAKILAP